MIRTELNANQTRANAKVMTKRLKELGVDVKHGQLLEALAAAYGHKTWHTMDKALKAANPEISVAQKHVLMCQASGTNDFNFVEMEWILIEINQELVNLILECRSKINEKSRHTEHRVEHWPASFGNFEQYDEDSDDDDIEEIPAEYSFLVVTKDYFWFEVEMRKQSGHFEHEPIRIDTFLQLAQKTGDQAIEIAEEEFGLSECGYRLNASCTTEDLKGYTGELFIVNKDGDDDFQHVLEKHGLVISKD